jgi:large repetitive protein
MGKIAGLFAVFVSIMLVVPCFAYSLPPVTEGLVGCWEFDEGSGVTAVDSTGNGNHGLMVNATYSDDTPPQALSNYSLRFNSTWGNAYSYVTIPDNSSLRPSSGLTLAAWVKAGNYEGRMRTIISKQIGTDGGDSFVLWYHDDGNLWFDIGGVGHITTAQPPANEWHHIVAAYNGSFMQLYVDGVEMVSSAASGSIPYDANPVLIGADSNQADHTPDAGWNGTIDNVLIYNKALNQTEISQIIPEFPSVLALSLFMSATIVGVIVYARRHRKRADLPFFIEIYPELLANEKKGILRETSP